MATLFIVNCSSWTYIPGIREGYIDDEKDFRGDGEGMVRNTHVEFVCGNIKLPALGTMQCSAVLRYFYRFIHDLRTFIQ